MKAAPPSCFARMCRMRFRSASARWIGVSAAPGTPKKYSTPSFSMVSMRTSTAVAPYVSGI
jgi:hypothetical protein